ncbi:MAG: UPF0179 family protein [Candidatus Nezhaarchaeales archaeon]
MSQEPIITLVGELQAKPGFKFVFKGATDVCTLCKLKEVCVMKLEPGIMYKVVETLKKRHKCPLREGSVVVVRVVETEVDALIDAKVAVEDAILTLRRKSCNNRNCKLWSLCQNDYVKDGEKYRVLKVWEESVTCDGKKMVRVTLVRVKG